MSKKKADRKPSSPEKMMADLHKLLGEQNFKSADEVNSFMHNLMASTGGFVPERSATSPVEQAQNIMYDAWETQNPAKRIKLAQKALEISPDCADAYVLLAEEKARTPGEARELYEKGVAAGQRAIGEKNFKKMKGEFWGFIETRPYMRARLGLAQTLWLIGERQAAADHMQEMLILNPNDNQGVRYLLATLLLEMGDDAALETLLKKYKDEWSANWKYTRALLAFRKEGKSKNAAKLLKDAVQYNPFIPPYLIGSKKLPKRMPAYYSPGDDTEAVTYAAEALGVWQETPGAVEWLREIAAEVNPKK